MQRIFRVLCILLLVSCSCDNKVDDLLSQVSAIADENPDSTYHLLEKLLLSDPDSAYTILVNHADDISQRGKDNQMKYRLLLADALNKKSKPLPSEKDFKEVATYFSKNGTHNEKMKAYYLLGGIYRDMGDAPKALECYYTALEQADTLSSDCDYSTLFRIYGQMAHIYQKQHLPNEEMKAWKRYSHYAKQAGDTYNYIRGIEFTLSPYYQLHDTSNLFNTTKRCYELYKSHGMPKQAASVFPCAIYSYIDHNQFDKAKRLIDIYENQSGLFDPNGNIASGRESYYYTKGRYCLGVNKKDSAEMYFRRLFKFNELYRAYSGLLNLYMAENNQDSIKKYVQLKSSSMDGHIDSLQTLSCKNASSLYNYKQYEKESTKNRSKAETSRRVAIVALFILLSGVIAAYFLFRAYRKKKENTIDDLQREIENAKTRNPEEKKLKVHDEKEKVRPDEMDEWRSKAEQYREDFSRLTDEERSFVLSHSNIVLELRQMITTPSQKRKLPNAQHWKRVKDLIEKYNPILLERVQQTHVLSKQEQLITMLVYLDFTNKEISALLNILPSGVSNAKKSINTKLFNDSEIKHIKDNLSQISQRPL